MRTSTFLVVALVAVCSCTRTGDPQADAAPGPDVTSSDTQSDVVVDGTTDRTPDGTIIDTTTDVPNADARPPCVGGSVWKTTSTAIEIRTSHFWSGVSGYLQPRAELTNAQRAALDGLCLIPTPTRRLADGMTYRITITDQDGTKTSYRASQGNYLEGNEGLPTVDVDSLAPFLATYSCLFSRSPRQPPPPVDGGAPWTLAPTMGTDTGCLNGVYVPSGCEQAWVKFKVDASIIARIGVFERSAAVTLRLFSPDGTTELAVAMPGSDADLLHPFATPDTYLLSIDRTAGTSCDAGSGAAGDLLLRISRYYP